MFDIKKLPNKYKFNQESLCVGKYVDDNSLYLYFILSRGLLSSVDVNYSAFSFLYFKPFEWTDSDYIAFLVITSRNYGLNICNIKLLLPAMEDEYEIQQSPRKFKGSYKWIQELVKNEPKREESILFEKFIHGKASVLDLERALIYADRFAPEYDKDDELFLSKDIFKNVLNYTSFSIEMDQDSSERMKKDVDSYIDDFINGNLKRDSGSKWIARTSISQPHNIFTFARHKKLFTDYLQKMTEDYGNTILIENIFQSRFPNLKYPDMTELKKRFLEKNFFFIHILLSFRKLGLIKMMNLGNNWDYHEENELTYTAKIEISPLAFSDNKSQKTAFDAEKSRLYVKGNEIIIKKFGNEYHVLKLIFEVISELEKEWFYSEIAEKIDSINPNEKRYSNAIYQTKLKLARKGINDFFVITKQSVKINSKYLS